MTTAFDFGAFPPEVNSAKMYAGSGSASMLAAAAAWNCLASELRSQAVNYSSTIANLTSEGWQGPASTSMTGAAQPYVAWMHTTAAQAEQTAGQAQAAAAAYEAAYGMTVPPPVIAANRAQLAALVATNLLGQNAPAIAATEAHYGQMWAQDAAAMYGYAAQSSAASTVPEFASAPQTTAPGALAGQAAATSQAGASTQATLSQVTSAMPGALQSMATPSSSTSLLSELEGLLSGGSSGNSQLDNFWSEWGPNANIWNTIFSSGFYTPGNTLGAFTSLIGSQGTGAAGEAAESLAGNGFGAAAGGLSSPLGGTGVLGGLGAAGSSMSAGLGQSASIGQLSVPPSWTAGPVPTPIASGLGATPLAAPPEVAAGVPGVAPTGAATGARAGATSGIMDNRFLIRPPMVPSWAAVG